MNLSDESSDGKHSTAANGRDAPKTKLKSATRGNPCPVCGGHRRCSLGADGLILCHAKQGEQAGFACQGAAKKDPSFTLYRRVDDPVLQAREEEYRARQGNGHIGAASLDWTKLAADYRAALTPERRDELAELLGVPATVIEALGIGWHDGPGCWTFPEIDAEGRIVGIGLRRRDGSKFQVTGGRRGLFVPSGWNERGGALLLPEGASNTLALTALGLSAVGRPSNLAGVENLARLLADYPADREIIVVGDFDPKPSGDWPGLAGCQRTAARLMTALRRKIGWVLPPAGSKDVRAWTNARMLPMDCADSWSESGEHLLADLLERRKDAIPETPGPAAVSNEPPPAPRFRFRTSAEFLQGDYRPEWLVRRLLVRGQPGVIGGPKKSLKTTLLVEMAYSLATGAAFLGRFDVPEKLRVGIMSGESGEFTLKETALRIAAAKNIDAFSENVLWEFTLPRLAYAADLADLQTAIRESGVQVLLIDPLYLCVLSGVGAGGLSASNLFQMGPLFLAVARTCLDVGCTPILAHHYKLTRPNPHDEPQLEDLAFAGIQEFARQWLLLGRRERYEQGSGQHKLWLSAGGSMGQSGLWSLDIDEGKLDEDFGGRQWCVSVETATEARQGERGRAEQLKAEKKRLDESKEEQRVLSVLCQLDPTNQGVIFTRLRVACAMSSEKMNQIVYRLVQAKALVEMELEADIGSKGKRKARGLRRVVETED